MNKWLCLHSLCVLLFFSMASPYLTSSEREIKVHLEAKAVLEPSYLGVVETEIGLFTAEYIDKIKGIFAFDLGNNGYCTLSMNDPYGEKLMQQGNPRESLDPARWLDRGCKVVFKVVLSNEAMDLYALTVLDGKLRHFRHIPLTKDLSRDRKQIHRVCDAATHSIFGVQGVASKTIVYSSSIEHSEHSWRGEIFQSDLDGSDRRQYTFDSHHAITPVVFPKGVHEKDHFFLYVSYKNGQPRIYLSSMIDQKVTPLISLRGNQLLPAISPQRDKIAFISDAGGRADLFIQAIDPHLLIPIGKPRQVFSMSNATQASPSFSQDGTKVAFVSNKDGSPRIYILDLNKEAKHPPEMITRLNRENISPNWSPDGKKIAYSSKVDGVRQIWVYDLDKREEKQLTQGEYNKENPAWGPNSLHLLYNTTDSGHCHLYLININQLQPIQLTKGSGKNHYPTWGNS